MPFASAAATAPFVNKNNNNHHPFAFPHPTRRSLQDENSNNDNKNVVWGLQSGPANGHTDAGGMIYDHERDQILLVGTTHDNQFFKSTTPWDGTSVDCFLATITLPPAADELSQTETSSISSPQVIEAAAAEEATAWKFDALHRITTMDTLDRCDLIATVSVGVSVSTTNGNRHDHTFLAGTIATATMPDDSSKVTAVEPLIYEATLAHFQSTMDGEETKIETGAPLQLFAGAAIQVDQSDNSHPTTPKKNDIIIPAIVTAHHHDLYMATIHRLLVVTEATSTAQPMMRLALGLSRFSATDETGNPLLMEWSHVFATSILEVRTDGSRPQAVTSSMFRDVPGMSAKEQEMLEHEQSQIENEVEEMEAEQMAHEEELVGMDIHRHEYKNDGVLISGLEVVDTENMDEMYLLVAGSAPGTEEHRGDGASNQTMSSHPFMDTSKSTTYVGDWDGFVAKVGARTGTILRPLEDFNVANTWSYHLKSQPKRNDFIQSLCVPRFPPGKLDKVDYYPTVAYVIGTTQGIVDGTQNGGAFIVQLDLDTMDVLWKKQIPGMNVHGMACQVLVDTESHGSTTRATTKDLIYIAGEVHGSMKVPVVEADGTKKEITTTAHGETDVWVAQLKASNGDVNWVHQIGTSQQERLAQNVNNPTISDGEQQSNIGETGSGKGALVLDRHGHAIVYGTTNGPLARKSTSGDRNRDIFVLRFHKDDGSYQSILPEQKETVTSSEGSSTQPPVATSSSSSSSSTEEPAQTHGGAQVQISTNALVIILGLTVPVILGIIIIVATGGQRERAAEQSWNSLPSNPAKLNVGFPPNVEHSDAPSSSSARGEPVPEHFNIL